VQSRVADLARVNGTLYCAVNSWGLAALKRDALGTPSFSYYFDSLIFGHRTITTLVPRGGTVAVHLYFNALLNDTRLADLPLSGICLVSFLPASSDYTFLIPPFQRKNPDWEAVGFAPSSENQFDFEWKFTDSSETRFAYTHYDADRQEEKPERRDSYVAALAVSSLSGKDVPQDLAAFFAACRDATAGLSRGAFFQFILRSDGAVRRIYRSGVEESDSAVVIPVFQEPGVRCALLPGGQVLYAPVGGTARLIALPPLAAGFRYTDLAKAGDSLVVPWEESTFTDVGSAGILLLTIKP
jgi:hypothetical protein